jgi:ribosome-associated protein
MDGREKAFVAAQAADGKKAKDVIILDMRRLSPLCDYFVIASGGSRLQMRSITEAIEEELGKNGVKLDHKEGNNESGWVLMDYNDLVVHVFSEEERSFYDLERLWQDANRLDLI